MQTLQERTEQKTPIFVAVNGDQFEMREALRRSIVDGEEQFLAKFISELLIRQYAAQNNISNSTEELQVAANERRYQNGLESVEKFQHWLKNNHQTVLSLHNDIDYQLLRNKVRGSIPDQEIEAYFVEHQLEFDRADLYSIRVCNQHTAEELYAKITEDGENFHLLAMEHSLDEESRPKAGYIGKVRRDELSAEIEAAVFNAQLGQVIGPIETEKGYNLFKVSAVYPANLAEEKDNIQFLLFEQLLTRLRAEAKITYPIFEEE
jgi:parvulin-like peptidyl-prolyl isomerase